MGYNCTTCYELSFNFIYEYNITLHDTIHYNPFTAGFYQYTNIYQFYGKTDKGMNTCGNV